MQTGTVKEISRKTDKSPWMIKTETGETIFTFENTGMNQGDEFDYEPEVKGNYINIKKGSFKLLSKTQVEKSVTSKGQKSIEERRSIERQVSVKVAAFLYAPGTANVDQVITDAEKIYRWISGSKSGQWPPPEEVKEKPEAKKQGTSSGKENPQVSDAVKERLDADEKLKKLYEMSQEKYGLTIGQVDKEAEKAGYDIKNPEHYRKIWNLISELYTIKFDK